MDDTLREAIELERLLHELNPEQPNDYVVYRRFEGAGDSAPAVTVSFNVIVRTRAAH